MKVAVTGIGLVTPLASSREASWSAILAGQTGIRPIEAGLEARVVDFSPNGARSRMGDFALLAAAEALSHARISRADLLRRNVGCAVSQSKPLLSSLRASEGGVAISYMRSPRRPSGPPRDDLDPTLLMSSFTGWSAEVLVQRELGIAGPTANLAAACATGVAALETGAHWIRSGSCDMVLAGASESSLDTFWRAGFDQLGVLAPGTDPKTIRPFDRQRSGFAMGEGAAVMVLESLERAQSDGRRPLAVLRKAVMGHGGGDLLRFDPDGSAVARIIRQAAGSDELPGYVNAHGTGTRFNDETEGRGLHLAFGSRTATVPVSSTKAATGHLLGAAGAVEAALAVLALRDGALPPTLNLQDPDVALDHVTGVSLRRSISSAISLSYGFGGQMGAVWFDAA